MSSTNSQKSYLLLAGKILFLAIFAAAFIRTYFWHPGPNFVDPYGFLFVLVGGVALMLISFPSAQIRSAFLHAVRIPGNDAEVRGSAYFWEAAGRGFWILGVSRSILNLILGFHALASEGNGLQMIMNKMAQSLLAMFYGSLLAVICFIPCWKLMGKLPDLPPASRAEPNEMPLSSASPGWRFGSVIGYVLFLAVLAASFRSAPGPSYLWWPGLRPALLIVVGGTGALMLFMGRTRSGPTLSTTFAGMGFIGSLMGCIQMMFAIASFSGPAGIAMLAGALALILYSCLFALLGVVLVGAPLEDRAILTGRVAAPLVFSRVSWYVFPLLAAMFQVLAFIMIITPITPH